MSLYNQLLPEFLRLGGQLLAISVEGLEPRRFAQERGFHFTLLTDLSNPKAGRSPYGVYRAGEGVTERALFVIDDKAVIRWSYVSPLHQPGCGWDPQRP